MGHKTNSHYINEELKVDSEYLLTLVESWVDSNEGSGYQHIYMDDFVILTPDMPPLHASFRSESTRWGKLTSVSVGIEVPDDERYPGYNYGWLNLPAGDKIDSESFCYAIKSIYKLYSKHAPYAKLLRA